MSADPRPSSVPFDPNAAVGALILRVGVGLLFAVAGINKFVGGIAGTRTYIVDSFKDTWLPAFMIVPYATVLPFAELIIGVAILLGIARFWSLTLGAAMMLSLVFGKMVLGDWPVVADNMAYMVFFAGALFAGRWDVFTVDRLLARGPRG